MADPLISDGRAGPVSTLCGQTIVLPLLVAREFHAFTFVFNGELEKPLHDPAFRAPRH